MGLSHRMCSLCSHHSLPNLPVHPPVHHHLQRMPRTGLVAELDSQARSAASLERKILEGKGLFAVHACLSCALALWCWTPACSADVDCPASQQDNIQLIWHPKHAHKNKSPDRGLVTGCREASVQGVLQSSCTSDHCSYSVIFAF